MTSHEAYLQFMQVGPESIDPNLPSFSKCLDGKWAIWSKKNRQSVYLVGWASLSGWLPDCQDLDNLRVAIEHAMTLMQIGVVSDSDLIRECVAMENIILPIEIYLLNGGDGVIDPAELLKGI